VGSLGSDLVDHPAERSHSTAIRLIVRRNGANGPSPLGKTRSRPSGRKVGNSLAGVNRSQGMLFCAAMSNGSNQLDATPLVLVVEPASTARRSRGSWFSTGFRRRGRCERHRLRRDIAIVATDSWRLEVSRIRDVRLIANPCASERSCCGRHRNSCDRCACGFRCDGASADWSGAC